MKQWPCDEADYPLEEWYGTKEFKMDVHKENFLRIFDGKCNVVNWFDRHHILLIQCNLSNSVWKNKTDPNKGTVVFIDPDKDKNADKS